MTQKRLLVGLALFALVVVLVLWAWALGERGGGLGNASSAAGSSARPDGALDGIQAGGGDAIEPARSAAERAAAAGDVQDPRRIRDASPGRFEVLVVDAATQEPVADADVRWLEVPWFTWWGDPGISKEIGTDLEAGMEKRGEHTLTDELGLALVSDPKKLLLVTARKGSSFGQDIIVAPEVDEPLTLAMRVQHDLTVRVVDEAGRPAPGITVGIGPAGESWSDWSRPTDEHGLLVVRNVEWLLGTVGLNLESAFSVRLEIGVDPQVERWIDPRRMPSEVVELSMPATGRMHVRVVDARGQVVPVQGRVLLSVERRPVQGELIAAADQVDTVTPLVDGEATIAGVGIGGRFDVTVSPAGGGTFGENFEGPRRAGELVEVAIPVPDSFLMLVGRAVDATAQPIASASLTLRTVREYLNEDRVLQMSPLEVRTDPEGRFAASLRLPPPDPSAHRAWRLRAELCWHMENLPRLAAELRVPTSGGIVEAGDVVLQASEPLLAGRVVDESGRPVPGGRVRVTRSSGNRRFSVMIEGGATDADGRFAVYGPCTGHALSLVLEHPDHRQDPVQAARTYACGTRDVVVTATRTGRVEGRLLVDAARLSAPPTLVLTQGPLSPGLWRLWREGPGWRFRFTGVPAGRCAIAVLDASSTAAVPVLTVEDVLVEAGEVTRDPRLDPIDLRGLLAAPGGARGGTLELAVVDERAASVSRGELWYPREGSLEHTTWTEGRALLPADTIGEVFAWSVGARVGRVQLPLRDPRLVLRPAHSTRITLTLPEPARAARTVCALELRALDGHGLPEEIPDRLQARTQRIAVSDDGVAWIDLPFAGRWIANLELHCTVRGIVQWASIEDVEGLRFRVREIDGEQSFTLDPGPEAWAECLEDLDLAGAKPR